MGAMERHLWPMKWTRLGDRFKLRRIAADGRLAALKGLARGVQSVDWKSALEELERSIETDADSVAQASDGSPTPGLGRSEAPGSAHFPDE